MKFKVFNFIGVSILILFVQCSGSKKLSYELQKEAPFQILKAEYREWIGGVEGVRGTSIELVIDNQDILIETLFFRNHQIIPKTKKVSQSELKITGNVTIKSKPDLILHKDPKMEYGNIPPERTLNFPFDIQIDEVVLSYKDQRNVKYIKIELVKGETQFYK